MLIKLELKAYDAKSITVNEPFMQLSYTESLPVYAHQS